MRQPQSNRCGDGGEARLDPSPARITLARRLTFSLAAMALLSTALAVGVQDRALSRDLASAAAARLSRAREAAGQLVDAHLRGLEDRYRVISTTPQVRATLEVGDAPTLGFMARELRQRQGAQLIAFLDEEGRLLAADGPGELLTPRPLDRGSALLSRAGATFAATAVPLDTGGRVLGTLLALEPLRPELLGQWSQLCGAELHVGSRPEPSPDVLVEVVRSLGGADLLVTADLAVEREALRRSRRELAVAGAAALLVALLACATLARSLVSPIRAIHGAVDRVRAGDFGVRLGSRRNDEIGDVARGVDLMLDHLEASRSELEARMGQLRQSQLHLAKAQGLARVGSFHLEADAGKLSGSAEFWRLLGFEAAARTGDQEDLFERIHADDRAAVREAFLVCAHDGVPGRLDHRVLLPDGASRVMHTQIQLVREALAGPARLEGTLQDVTERRRAEEQIRYLAYHDSLTGLGNRLLFVQRTEMAISQARRRGSRLGVLFLDLDHFKRINDTLGHSVGDELLQEVAARILRSIRESDLLVRGRDEGSEAAISRLGGDEFTVLLQDVADPRSLASVAQRILDTLSRAFQLGGHELVVGASIGIAIWPADGETIDALMSSADSAMYHAKSSGRNNYQFCDQSMNAAALRRLKLEERMRRSLEEGAFELFYQPRVSLRENRICGFEALMRWRDAELGPISPGDFIPVAEQTGLVVPLGGFALRRACERIRAWSSELGSLDIRVSVNVSARQFRSSDVAREVALALEATGVNPLRLELEITEGTVLHDEAGVVASLRELRRLGVSIALDDFGTGYSSLSYLRRLPVDTLKIDMSFIHGITRSSEDAALTRAIVAMGGALGLRVVAEGVETAEQLDLLRSWGCDEIQGFVVSPALAAADALARLRAGVALPPLAG